MAAGPSVRQLPPAPLVSGRSRPI